ncbi:hypothetical protein E8E15_000300, partial [Penicillium rubens]
MRYHLGCICAAQDRGTRGDLGAPSMVHGNLFDLHVCLADHSVYLPNQSPCQRPRFLHDSGLSHCICCPAYPPGFVHPERKELLLLVNTPVFPRGFAAV